MKRLDDIIDDVIAAEGGYTDDPNDSGGKTCWGITEAVARANGYDGPMDKLPKSIARDIYFRRYIIEPGFDRVVDVMPGAGVELVDTGVNMGQSTAGRFLQSALNAFNKRGAIYPDVKVDGNVGAKTIAALEAYKAHRGAEAEPVLLKALNCLQGARYLLLADERPKDEDYVFGWIKNRVGL